MATANLGTRVGYGVYRNKEGQLTNTRGSMLQRPGRTTTPTSNRRTVTTNPVTSSPTTTAPGASQPDQQNPASVWTRFGAGQYKDQYGNVLRGQAKAPTVNKAKPYRTLPMPTNGNNPAPDPTASSQTPETPAPTASAEPDVPAFTNYQSPMTKALMDAMGKGMSTMQAYEPQYFEGSPLYQFQKQKGMADLEKLMASRGLTGSGAEIQNNKDFLLELNATEAEKQRQYAEANQNRQQQMTQFIANFDSQEREALRDQWNKDLDQRTNVQQFEANRQDARQAAGASFLMQLLGLQSQNDIARISQGGMNSQTDLSKALLSAATNNTMSQVPRGGGGGGGTPPPPPPSNTSGLYEILTGYGNRAGNNDFLNGILRMFSGK